MSGAVQELSELIVDRMAQQSVPGCAWALIEDGQVTTVRCYGVADARTGAPVTPETRFCWQSVSKSVAAWAVMKLVEDGRLDLDAPISRYLRRWTLPASDRFDLDLVTPRRLLSHHAGITTAGFRGVPADIPGYTLLDAFEARLPPPNAEQKRHYAYWDLLEDEPVTVTYPPGEAWHYSNPGFGLIELAIEDITGRTYAEVVQEALFDPLQMSGAGYGRRPGAPEAWPHGRDGAPAGDYRWLCGAAAGVFGNIHDLARFASAALRGPDGLPPGRGIVHASSLAVMHTPHGAADQVGDLAFQAGLGHLILEAGGLRNVHHSGGSIGWRSIYSIFPEQGAGICLLLNGEAANEVMSPAVQLWRRSVAG